MPANAIHTERLTRDFGTVRALDDVTLDIPSGIVFGFLGPNGAGKTTMIRSLLGLLEPSAGTAETLGFSLPGDGARVRERTGALLEYTGLYERLSAEENLDFYGRVYRIPSNERRDRIRELLTHFGLWERKDNRIGDWSRGMKQKLAVARAIFHRPELIFLDEPTAGLDPVAAASLRDDLAELVSNEGVTVFLTTHNLTEAEKLCSLVGVINKGRLMNVGHPDELRSRGGGIRAEIIGSGFTDAIITGLQGREDVKEVWIDNGRMSLDLRENARMAPIVSYLVSKDVEIEEVRKGKASLEEAFIAMLEEERE